MITSPLAWDESSEGLTGEIEKKINNFFSVFNFNVTHESNIWKNETTYSTKELDYVQIPAFFPETLKSKVIS